jgi:TfoX/Sxy family transcriptional regulator of competence genes
MAFDEDLAARVRERLAGWAGVGEKRMFGGLCFFLHGNLLVGVRADSLLVRLGAEQAAEAVQQPHVTPFINGGRPMTGWVVVAWEAVQEDDDLAGWLDRAADFVGTLPPK